MPYYAYDRDYPFAAFLPNLGRYNEGNLEGAWLTEFNYLRETEDSFHKYYDGNHDSISDEYHVLDFPNKVSEMDHSNTEKKLTVLVVEPGKEPYVKEIEPGLKSLQAEVGGYIAVAYPFDDPVGLVLNDEGKLIGLELNRSLRDDQGEIYDIVAGTFLVTGLSTEDLASLSPEMIQKYATYFKQPELFTYINGQIISIPVETEKVQNIISEEKISVRQQLKNAKQSRKERKSSDISIFLDDIYGDR